MSLRIRYAATVLALLLCASPARAEWQTHRRANVQFNVPTGWLMRARGPVLTVAPQTGGLGVEFVALTNPSTNAIIERQLMGYLRGSFQAVRVTQPVRPITQNGLAGVALRGVGMRNGQLLEWFALAIGADGRGVAAIGFALPGQITGNAALITMLNSIQPIR
ncbi:MAG: hypothetical protein JNK05_21290 [Myxococcales bacterium]|nr:hypothetical protein [Myxococcales bacterium]